MNQNIASTPQVFLYPFITSCLAGYPSPEDYSDIGLFYFLHTVAAPVGPVVPTPTVLPMGAPVPRPRGPPPPPGDENREVRTAGFFLWSERLWFGGAALGSSGSL